MSATQQLKDAKPIVNFESSQRGTKKILSYSVSAILKGREFYSEDCFRETFKKDGKVFVLIIPEEDNDEAVEGISRFMHLTRIILENVDKNYIESFALQFHDPKDQSIVYEEWRLVVEEIFPKNHASPDEPNADRETKLQRKGENRPTTVSPEEFQQMVYGLLHSINKVIKALDPLNCDERDLRLGLETHFRPIAQNAGDIPPEFPTGLAYSTDVPNPSRFQVGIINLPFHRIEVKVKTSCYNKARMKPRAGKGTRETAKSDLVEPSVKRRC